MSYITIYLKAADEQTMIDALTPLLGVDDSGKLITASHQHHVILLPNLTRTTGVILTDGGGNEYPETETITGYHTNLRTKSQDVVDAVQHLVVVPNSPSAVFS